MIKKYLKSLKSLEITDIQRKATFETKFMVPGFFSFYHDISNFISKEITKNFFINEKKLRESTKNIPKLKDIFHSEEAKHLKILIEEINKDASNKYKFINEVINTCPTDLLQNDYIYYFLNKNNEKINIIIEENIEIDSNISSIENDEEDEKEEKETVSKDDEI